MPPLPPDDLFEQAEALAGRAGARQVDLRRAISAAYYGLFHFTMTAAADLVIGAENRSTARYTLVYRSADHGRLRSLCSQLGGTKPQNLPLAPADGFGRLADFARIVGNLYELRNLADYDPSRDFTADEARVAISDAREAIKWFQQGTAEQRETFLISLLFKPR